MDSWRRLHVVRVGMDVDDCPHGVFAEPVPGGALEFNGGHASASEQVTALDSTHLTVSISVNCIQDY
jgi:hypothetical protein